MFDLSKYMRGEGGCQRRSTMSTDLSFEQKFRIINAIAVSELSFSRLASRLRESLERAGGPDTAMQILLKECRMQNSYIYSD